MDSMDGKNGMDNMDNTVEFAQPEDTGGAAASGTPGPAGGRGRAKWSSRTKRIATTVAVSTVLLGSGAAIGVALTGGASASTGGTSPAATSTSATTTATSSRAGRCADLVERLAANSHPVAAKRLGRFCRSALLRLALVGGEHGEVTFQTKAGPKTIAVERGTVQDASSANITVVAKDGTTWTWDFVSNTVVRENRQVVGRNTLSNGQTVLVLGQVTGGVYDARLIRVRS
jgi:hypothetical protein